MVSYHFLDCIVKEFYEVDNFLVQLNFIAKASIIYLVFKIQQFCQKNSIDVSGQNVREGYHNNKINMWLGEVTKTLEEKSVRISYGDHCLAVAVEDLKFGDKFRGDYNYDNLPIQFKILFENLKDFYSFLVEDFENRVRVSNGTMYVIAEIVGKIRQFYLPLVQIQLTIEEKFKKQLKILEYKLKSQEKELQESEEKSKCWKKLAQEKQINLQLLTNKLNEKQSENMKLCSRIRQLENSLEDLMQKGRTQSMSKSQKQRKEAAECGKKLIFRLDQSAKHYNKFTILGGGEVQKLKGPTYQLYHNECIPREGRFYFDIKILSIKNSNIVVGVITQKNKEEQFSFKKNNCVCYNGYDGSICEQDKQSYVNIKPKQGNKLRTVVNVCEGTIEWYVIGEGPKVYVGKATIPAFMIRQGLIPYFELYWENNRIKLNA